MSLTLTRFTRCKSHFIPTPATQIFGQLKRTLAIFRARDGDNSSFHERKNGDFGNPQIFRRVKYEKVGLFFHRSFDMNVTFEKGKSKKE